jgi:2-polyprenyl-6-methoxyphenol hydroxylase-like FAD-dependent oxidoreductase
VAPLASNNPPHEFFVNFWHGVAMKGEHISILGGGIAGLSAAIGAASTGRGVTIYEKAEKFDPIGAGLQLGPNAVRALKTIGAWDAVEPITSSPPTIHMRDGLSGRLLKSIALGKTFEQRFGEPYRVAMRADLHEALLSVVQTFPAIEIKMGQNVASTPTLAADGLWSKTREQLFPNSQALKIKDQAFRSLFQSPETSSIDMNAVNLWLFPGGHVVHYQVGQDQKLNLVAITDGAKPIDFFGKASRDLKLIVGAAPNWSLWPMAYVPPLPSWTKNKTTLIGDAAHGTLPYLAQGAAMALEDAAALVKTDFNLEIFHRVRATRCAKLHNSSMRAGKIYHMKGLAAKARNLALALLPERSFLSRLEWIYLS